MKTDNKNSRGLGYVTENCLIDSKQAKDILADLKDRKDLVQMTFENNEILDVPAMCNVFKQLRSFEKLESLNFRCNKNFNDDIVQALAEGINLKKELRTVDLGENDITDRGIQILGDALKTHVRLHMLFLDSNQISANGADGLSECLKNK